MSNPDAVVVGGGPNGLVAANLLADAGWDVLVLESQPTVGGAVRSNGDVYDGYVHDVYSSFYPMAVVSPAMLSLELDKHGLEWAHAPAVVGTPFSNGDWALQHRDRTMTAAGLDRLAPGDGDAYLRVVETWDKVGDDIIGAMLRPFPPLRDGLRILPKLRKAGGLSLIRTLLAPARSMVDERFSGAAAKMLFAGNAVHADIPLDAPGSGLLGLILAMLGQSVGFPVPRGGAGMLTKALEDRFTALGGRVVTGARVVDVLVRDGRATGVRTEHGDVHTARRAVLADVSAPALFGGLVSWDHLPDRLRSGMGRFIWDPGTVKVDWALNGPVPWENPPEVAPGTLHIGESVDEIARTQLEIAAEAVPSRPFLLVGQMATTDPTRAPAGCESLWAYTHVPQRTRSDAGDGSITGAWDSADLERIGDRVQGRLEEYAPAFADRVLTRRVLGPRELQAGNENLVNGALNGGTAQLHQQLVFRPVPGFARAETPVRGLYLASASAHPGGAVHGACGSNAARAALAHARLHPRA
jgi:phytoene dehydrogenase-like protein